MFKLNTSLTAMNKINLSSKNSVGIISKCKYTNTNIDTYMRRRTVYWICLWCKFCCLQLCFNFLFIYLFSIYYIIIYPLRSFHVTGLQFLVVNNYADILPRRVAQEYSTCSLTKKSTYERENRRAARFIFASIVIPNY